MRLRVVLIAVFAVLALAATAGADPDPGGVVTDDPAEQHDPALGLDGSGISSVERYLGNQAPATRIRGSRETFRSWVRCS
jgi:hypothetical protein